MQDENEYYSADSNRDKDAQTGRENAEASEAFAFSSDGNESGASFVEYGPSAASYGQAAAKINGGKGLVALFVAACLLFAAIAGVGGLLVGKSLWGKGGAGYLNGLLNGTGGASETVIINTLPKETVIADGTCASVGAACASSVVEIRTAPVESGYGTTVSGAAGSGVVIGFGKTTDFPYIVTNNHVVEGYSSITVLSSTGESYNAVLIGTDWMSDIAVLVVEDSTTSLTAATCGDSTKIVLGEEVVAIGNPLGALGGSLTEGVISAVSRTISVEGIPMTLLQTSAAINPGNSGGALFDMQGRLIGIVNSKIIGSSVDGIGFAIPINTALDKVEELLEQGFVSGTPDLGLVFASSGSTTVYSYLYNDEIASSGQEIKANDILYSIDGVVVEEYEDYRSILASLINRDGSFKESVSVVFLRPVSSGIFAKYNKITVELKVHEYIPSALLEPDEDVNINGE